MTRRVVLDTDFGHGERFMAEWRALPPQGMLHYLAVTPHVPSVDASADEELRALWPLDVPGFHRILLDDGRVTLDLLVGALDAVLPQIAARVDAFHVDASFPASQARGLAKLAVLGATLRARAPDEALAWALTAAGFVCKAIEGTQDIGAVYQSRRPQPAPPPEPVRRAIVIGAGVAGSAASHRLCASGWDVTLIERHAAPAQEASGNVAGIFMPLLSKDDNIPTRLSRAAYTFALRKWRRLGGVGRVFDGASCGVLQLARDADHAIVQQDVVAAWNYPEEYVRWLDAGAAGELLGGATPHGGWLFGQGGWARPASLCAAMLDACGERLRRVFTTEVLDLQRVEGEWQVRGGDGALIAQAPTVVLANGTGAVNIAQAAELPLSRLRGQVTHLPVPDAAHAATAPAPPVLPLVVCREAYVTPPSGGIVCAGATYDNDDDPELRADSQLENLTRLAEIVPGEAVAALASTAPLAGRVGFRCAAPDRLPLAGALPDYPSAGRLERLRDVPRHPGLYGLLGYASRGLIWAPLMAELLVSQLENAPPPLEAMLVDALDPGRFLLKQRRRSQ
ncbi:FAD-dependent oxidoreductase [Duganella sp. BJB488]|uniref:FAD-dependent 5-carboxymethylaminomethyl-2-thiouridine(34) oxidoreductase MnmC n=1 Tax=unclassified Duganella TaxID=2636909 RepID=UPI000E34441C|nr:MULTISPECIES: FAD-dependent 5-carboxymethylaminomethyl-2-thiouridine(34) oxidoreductase MnmC [unclassified Duganella]RFP13997.1 FAD-dependent oxidoreductase [Duganella sp. BJB489]RFP17418.1 FAD-dependent oxidoreductase [Duganella sp. BJB488]RFP31792.1 FAD-dependent oxidoreductase [Duganella sp. BJB480]